MMKLDGKFGVRVSITSRVTFSIASRSEPSPQLYFSSRRGCDVKTPVQLQDRNCAYYMTRRFKRVSCVEQQIPTILFAGLGDLVPYFALPRKLVADVNRAVVGGSDGRSSWER